MERKLAAIMVADIVGYSRLMGHDEAGALQSLKSLRSGIIDPQVAAHKGRIFKATGDGVLAEFPSIVEAVSCADEIQRALAGQTLQLRIGVNMGDVVVEGDDIFGDGVNLAARLEQLAAPGGVLISGTAYDQLQGKLDLPFEFDGERQVKNIDRPVRIYRLASGAKPATPAPPVARRIFRWARLVVPALLAIWLAVAAAWWFWPAPEASAKPAVAVLPFVNIAGDEETGRLADGITQDIITDLAQISAIEVIARNSTEVFKGKPVDIAQIANALRVGYVLDGSIQHQAGRVRVTAELVDAKSSKHLWSQRWDRPDQDLFAVQSEIAEQVTSELGRDAGVILTAVRETARHKQPGNLSAYEAYLLAYEKLERPDAANLQQSVDLFKRAIELDPQFARAFSGLSYAYNILSYSGDEFDKWHRLARDAAEQAVALDPNDAAAHAALAAILVSEGDVIRGKSEAETALRLSPGSAVILTQYSAWAASLDNAKRGGEAADQAIRLDPNYPASSVPSLAYGYFAADRYRDALDVLARLPVDAYTPDMWVVHPGALAVLGKADEAKQWVAEALKRYPHLTAEGWANSPGYADEERQRFLKTMKLGGFPLCAGKEQLAKIATPVTLPECANAP